VRVTKNIYVDASERAAVIFEGGSQTVECLTMQEAVLLFFELDPDERSVATIETKSGRKFVADEVDRLRYR
jgi:hypothetical protein